MLGVGVTGLGEGKRTRKSRKKLLFSASLAKLNAWAFVGSGAVLMTVCATLKFSSGPP